MADLDPVKRDVKLTLPMEAADGLMSAFMPTGPLTPSTPMAPPARPTFTPRPAAPPGASPPPAVPAAAGSPAGVLPPIVSSPSPASLPPPAGSHLAAVPDAPQKSTMQKIGGTLGRIGGYALGAVAPGVAAQIPSTPLGKIAAQNRELRQEQVTAETGQKVAAADLAKAGAARDVAETKKVEGETKNLEAGGWKDAGGEPIVVGDKIYARQTNPAGQNRFVEIPPPGADASGGAAAAPPAGGAAPIPSAGGVPAAAAPAPAPAPAFTKLGTAPKEADEPLTPAEIAQMNAESLLQYQVLNKDAKTLPAEYTLPANAKVKDATRVSAALTRTENAVGTQAARENTQATRELNRTVQLQKAEDTRRAQLDREVDKSRADLKEPMSKLNEKLENLNEAMSMLERPNAMKDALVVVKSLVAAAGGQGSGVRITMPEINRIADARGIQGGAEVFMNKVLSLIDDNKYETLSDNQRQQLSGMLGDIRDRIQQKLEIANGALNTITNAADVKAIRKAQTDMTSALNEFNKTGPAALGGKGGGGEPPAGTVPMMRNGKPYNIPKDQVAEFEKAGGKQQ
jgi:hypothetical protein